MVAIGLLALAAGGAKREGTLWEKRYSTMNCGDSLVVERPSDQMEDEGSTPISPLHFNAAMRASCRVEVCSRADFDLFIRYHYIGHWPGVVVLILGVRHNGRLRGGVMFALPPRETSTRYGGVTWELARLWVEDWMPLNTESWLLAQAVRHIRKERPDVKYLVSYADPSAGHKGTIYKAANWKPDGRTDDERKTPRFDYTDAETGKKYSRRGHVPEGITIKRVPRVSKHRFVYALRTQSAKNSDAQS